MKVIQMRIKGIVFGCWCLRLCKYTVYTCTLDPSTNETMWFILIVTAIVFFYYSSRVYFKKINRYHAKLRHQSFLVGLHMGVVIKKNCV